MLCITVSWHHDGNFRVSTVFIYPFKQYKLSYYILIFSWYLIDQAVLSRTLDMFCQATLRLWPRTMFNSDVKHEHINEILIQICGFFHVGPRDNSEWPLAQQLSTIVTGVPGKYLYWPLACLFHSIFLLSLVITCPVVTRLSILER